MTRYELNAATLLRVLDERRQRNGQSWRQFAEETGVSHVLFHRMREGKKPTADQLLTLLTYLGADYLPFTRSAGKGKPEQD